jgi:hypothetical protein
LYCRAIVYERCIQIDHDVRMLDIPALWRGQDIPDEAREAYELIWDRERPELERFQQFWKRHETDEAPYVVSFAGGMLHFLYECLAHVPRDRVVFAVGSGLSEEEERWAAANLHVPFHAIHIDVDDKTVWEYLFATARRGFVWLDVDCFVVDTTILDDLTASLADNELRGVWKRSGGGRTPVLQTTLVAVGADVPALVNQTVPTSPATYCHFLTRFGRHRLDVSSRVLLPAHRDALRHYVEVDDDGAVQGILPGIVDVYTDTACYSTYMRQTVHDAIADGSNRREFAYVDTTVMMQLMAREAGCPVTVMTSLESYLISKELIHNGHVGYHRWGYMDRSTLPGASTSAPRYGRPDLLPRPGMPSMVLDLPLLSHFVRRFPLPSYCELEHELIDKWQRYSIRKAEFGNTSQDLERALSGKLNDAGLDREALFLLRDHRRAAV